MHRKDKNNNSKKNIIVFILLYLFVVVLFSRCYNMVGSGTEDSGTPLYYIVFLTSLFIYLFFHTIIHELGHMVFGLLTGYRVVSFRIFSLTFLKADGKIKIKKYKLPGTAGQCLMSPPKLPAEKTPIVLYNSGGALLNLIFSLIALFTALFVPAVKQSAVGLHFVTFSLVGTFIAIFNGFPLKTKLISNDGANTVDFLKSLKAKESFLLQLKVSELDASGVRLRDMPSEWFTIPSDEDMKNSLLSTAGVFTCNRMVDELQFDKADELTEYLLSRDNAVNGIYKAMLRCDQIYCRIMTDKPRDEIHKLLSKEQRNIMKKLNCLLSVIRTEYACALLFDNDPLKAAALKDKFYKTMEKYPYEGTANSEQQLFSLIEEHAKQKISG